MIEAQMEWADVVVLGPGLEADPMWNIWWRDILTSAFVPVIIDADGLNAAGHPYLTSYYTENIIVTPHLEMARLTGRESIRIKENLAATALEYAGRYGLTCVLKDAATVTGDGTEPVHQLQRQQRHGKGRLRRRAHRHHSRSDSHWNGGRGGGVPVWVYIFMDGQGTRLPLKAAPTACWLRNWRMLLAV